ncbi:MAG: carbon-nitrogen hydrolase family protein [Candidatus Limnocylindrales bacterium]|jgi:predicted amidohydrolase
MSRLKVALVQLAADGDAGANVDRAAALIRKAGASKPGLIALPEMFQYRGPVAGFRESATTLPGPLTEEFSELARNLGSWILLGSLAELSTDPMRPFNTSVLLDPVGRIAATYRKRHLFDVVIENGPSDRESARITPGYSSVVAVLEGAAEGADVCLGLSICFDLRFPELYRELTAAGAVVMAVPANFTEATGRDHWEVLLRARAIENGAFVIAPAQCGIGAGVPAHGRSMVVDPWGIVIAQAPDGPGVVVADLDLERVVAVRRGLPTRPSR